MKFRYPHLVAFLSAAVHASSSGAGGPNGGGYHPHQHQSQQWQSSPEYNNYWSHQYSQYSQYPSGVQQGYGYQPQVNSQPQEQQQPTAVSRGDDVRDEQTGHLSHDRDHESAVDDADQARSSSASRDSIELAPPWQEYIDPSSGRPYYYNPETSVTQWERPVQEVGEEPDQGSTTLSKVQIDQSSADGQHQNTEEDSSFANPNTHVDNEPEAEKLPQDYSSAGDMDPFSTAFSQYGNQRYDSNDRAESRVDGSSSGGDKRKFTEQVPLQSNQYSQSQQVRPNLDSQSQQPQGSVLKTPPQYSRGSPPWGEQHKQQQSQPQQQIQPREELLMQPRSAWTRDRFNQHPAQQQIQQREYPSGLSSQQELPRQQLPYQQSQQYVGPQQGWQRQQPQPTQLQQQQQQQQPTPQNQPPPGYPMRPGYGIPPYQQPVQRGPSQRGPPSYGNYPSQPYPHQYSSFSSPQQPRSGINSAGNGQLVTQKSADLSSAVREKWGQAIMGLGMFGSRTKELAASAKNQIGESASSAGKAIGETSSGIWGKLRTGIDQVKGSIFERSDEYQGSGNQGYPLSQFGVPPPSGQGQRGQPPPEFGGRSYPPNYPSSGYYPPGATYPGPREGYVPRPSYSSPYPHLGPGPQSTNIPPMQSQWGQQSGQTGPGRPSPPPLQQMPQQLQQQVGQGLQSQPPYGQYPPYPQTYAPVQEEKGQQQPRNPADHPGWNQ